MNSKKSKKRIKEKDAVIMALPNFTNQLLLLINCGMTVNEAFINISNKTLNGKEDIEFYSKIASITKTAMESGGSPIKEFYGFCRQSKIKELSKLGSLLWENQHKGTDLRRFLKEQGDSLWEERKQLVMKNIKLSESKMSFPLGILLMTLIIITSAPAIMQI